MVGKTLELGLLGDLRPVKVEPAEDNLVLAIDPGCERSAYVTVGSPSRGRRVYERGKIDNEELLGLLIAGSFPAASELAIEMVQGFGMPVGKEVFETVFWIGRFVQAWSGPFSRVYRKDVKFHLCRSYHAKDPHIRQAVLDLYPATGGGARPQIGTKGQPGPLYNVAADVWSALAVAITYQDTRPPVQGAEGDV
jgi:hypothetical protein